MTLGLDLVAAQGIFDLWSNYEVFVTVLIAFVALLGFLSKSFAVPAYGGYLTFAYVALTTETQLFMSILYVTLSLIFVGFAFKIWRSEITGAGS